MHLIGDLLCFKTLARWSRYGNENPSSSVVTLFGTYVAIMYGNLQM